MSRKIKKLYQCPICGLKYKEKQWTEKCENWCLKYKSCNLEITKHSINNLRLKPNNLKVTIKN